MGGRPLFCLNLVGWPRETLPLELLGEVLEGAARVTALAGCPMLGGHTIDDPEPKFGLAVIGEAHPDRLLTNAGARAGDWLLLTKPLGTGILATALKRDLVTEADLAEAVTSMTTLNDVAARAAVEHGASAATDVTGFGLLGHLGNIMKRSGVGAVVAFESLPLLSGALELARLGAVPGGTRRNLESAVAEWDADLTEPERLLCTDAQTSGGLLIAVAPERAPAMLAALRDGATPAAAVIGRITAAPTLRVQRRLGDG
jgi:selenide,water dikinase